MATLSERFGLTAGIDDNTYHADRNTLSASGAKKILQLPARFAWDRDHPPAGSAAFDIGKLAHKVILGEGAEVVVVDAGNWMTKAAKEARDEARAAGKIPCLVSEWEAAEKMLVSVQSHDAAAELLSDGEAELSGYWRDEPTDVGLRFRPDWLTEQDGRTVCVDVKTTVSADPDQFGRSVAKFMYDLQAVWYIRGLAAHGLEDARFLFIAVEKSPPYPVSVIELDADAMDRGAWLMRRAIDSYADCVARNKWPSYGDGVHTIGLPKWALGQDFAEHQASLLIAELGAM